MGKPVSAIRLVDPRLEASYQTFWRKVTEDGRRPCALRGTTCHRCDGKGCLRCRFTGVVPCSSILDAHHYVPKRRLRTDAAKRDARNGVPLCRDHHDLVEQRFLHSPRPKELPFFLVEHDVPDWALP